MYFYVIKNIGSLGFGITGDYQKRAQDYVSHSGPGCGAYFPYVLAGHGPHIKKLESLIKTQWIDRTWITPDGWKTEWLKEEEELDTFISDIMDAIKERHLKVEVFRKDYDFLTSLD